MVNFLRPTACCVLRSSNTGFSSENVDFVSMLLCGGNNYALCISYFKFSQNNNDIRFEILLAKIDIFCNDISVTLNESFPITSD